MQVNNYINHIALVLDASASMGSKTQEVVKVADNLVKHIAQRSQELDQETRVTIYSFANKTTCLVYDKDVLRLPSISNLYRVDGTTALIDATLQSLDDLSKTPELYGEHAFLVYVLTDGEDNDSKTKPIELSQRLNKLPDHWTVAVFVPNITGVHEAKRFGFPKDNIQVWDINAKQGIEGVGETIRQATDNFMAARSRGVRGSRNIFNLDISKINAKNVVKVLDKHVGKHFLLHVSKEGMISTFIEVTTGKSYQIGSAYYQLTKPEKVQASKQVALVSKNTGEVFTGPQTRAMLQLPNQEVKVSPTSHPEFNIFIQSTSVNRKLVPGTSVLLFT
jgi:uncharacterized protein YegL